MSTTIVYPARIIEPVDHHSYVTAQLSQQEVQ